MGKKPIWCDPDPSWSGADRRDPKFTNPAYITLRLLRETIEEFTTQVISEAILLDLGCGEVPYAPLFDEGVNYISLDRDLKYPVRVKGDLGEHLPFGDQTFDAVLCTQVLEHVQDPYLVAMEIYRVLKPDGVGFISVPFAWEIHHYPKDYHRFTPDSMRWLFQKFSKCDVMPLESSEQAWWQARLIRWDRRYPNSAWRKWVIGRVNRWIDRRRHQFDEYLHPGNIVARIRK